MSEAGVAILFDGTDVEQVVEFEIGGESYCVSIAYVSEVVDTSAVSTIPESPPHVEGVMDLRGETTTIVDPAVLLNLDNRGEARRVIVFDPDVFEEEQTIGWTVEEVHEVSRIAVDDVEEAPADDPGIVGAVKRDGEFVVWIDPEVLHGR